MATDILSNVWPEWKIEGKPLGRGSYGTVYKAVRRDHNVESYAAIKVISIPSDQSEVDSLRSEGLDINATRTYLQGVVNDFVSEIQLMESFKGVQNIVSVEDYRVVEKKDEIGWDIFIRMELLTPLNSYICDKTLTEAEVIKLGVDICSALELCAKRNVIHRDIKPENIFMNQFGDFKLGDFGIARKLENVTGGLSQKGTYNYMAPEVEKGTQYDATVDLYSLGLVLYRFTNKNRLPFLDTERQLLNPNERMAAIRRRMDGEPLPAPCAASPALAQVILCACAHDPKRRFSSASAMKNALLNAANGANTGANNLNKTVSVRHTQQAQDPNRTTSVRKAPQVQEPAQKQVGTFGGKKKSKVPAVIASILIVVILIGVGVFVIPKLLGKNNSNGGSSMENTDHLSTKESGGSDASVDTTNGVYSNYDEDQIAAAIEDAEALAADEDFEGALTIVKTALATYPKSEALKSKAAQYTEALATQVKTKTLSEAASCADSGDYVAAITLMKSVEGSYGEDVDFATAYNAYCNTYKAKIIEEADKLAADANFLGAIQKIAEATEVIGNETDLADKSEEYETLYVDGVIKQANDLLEEKRISEAKSLLEDAGVLFPHNTLLSNRISEVNDAYMYADIIKTFIGTYNSGTTVRGFDLEISSCDKNGKITAMFSFYSLEENDNLFGSYQMQGSVVSKLSDGSLMVSLIGTEWVVHPESFSMIDLDIAINPDRTKIRSDEFEVLGVDKNATHMYDYDNIIGLYSGTYMPSWGVTCLDLSILSIDEDTGDIQAEFSFYPHEHNPEARTGKYLMNGRVVYELADGSIKLCLTGFKWINKPEHTVMLDFFLIISNDKLHAVSDSYQINLSRQ